MVILVGFRINIEGQGELSIPFKASTFLVTLQCLLTIALARLGSVTFDLLFEVLAIAGNEHFTLAWLVFPARRRCMA